MPQNVSFMINLLAQKINDKKIYLQYFFRDTGNTLKIRLQWSRSTHIMHRRVKLSKFLAVFLIFAPRHHLDKNRFLCSQKYRLVTNRKYVCMYRLVHIYTHDICL